MSFRGLRIGRGKSYGVLWRGRDDNNNMGEAIVACVLCFSFAKMQKNQLMETMQIILRFLASFWFLKFSRKFSLKFLPYKMMLYEQPKLNSHEMELIDSAARMFWLLKDRKKKWKLQGTVWWEWGNHDSFCFARLFSYFAPYSRA